MKPLRERILEMFAKMNVQRLDLHVLFEAAGNDPAERETNQAENQDMNKDGSWRWELSSGPTCQ